MLLVGLTGNIGSGKSTVAQLLSERGATIITLAHAAEDDVRDVLRLAWQNTAPKRLLLDPNV